jgi:cytochrome b559 alpha subunit
MHQTQNKPTPKDVELNMFRSIGGCSFADISIIILSLFNAGCLFVNTRLTYDVFGSPIPNKYFTESMDFILVNLIFEHISDKKDL